VGPPIEGVLLETEGYASRTLVDFETHKDYLMAVVDEQLAKIKDSNSFFAAYTKNLVNGESIEPRSKWVMVLQALQFCSNDLANSGVADGSYKNTQDHLENPQELLLALHHFFDKHRQESWAATIREKNFSNAALQLVLTKNIWAFAGRMMKSCPTRGGNVFDYVISHFCTATFSIPLLPEKLSIIFTGKLKEDGESFIVHAEGVSWVHCTTTVAKKLKQIVGEEAFTQIELSMYGHWGWVYRPSDLPNRHGHCNSRPNLLLSSNFTGFGI